MGRGLLHSSGVEWPMRCWCSPRRRCYCSRPAPPAAALLYGAVAPSLTPARSSEMSWRACPLGIPALPPPSCSHCSGQVAAVCGGGRVSALAIALCPAGRLAPRLLPMGGRIFFVVLVWRFIPNKVRSASLSCSRCRCPSRPGLPVLQGPGVPRGAHPQPRPSHAQVPPAVRRGGRLLRQLSSGPGTDTAPGPGEV